MDEPLYRCTGNPAHAYRLAEAIDGGCPQCWEASQRIRGVTAGQNEGSAANEFEKRVRQDI